MNPWVDVRVARADQEDAIEVLTFAFPGELALNERPPAAGPEVQLSVRHHDEDEVAATLEQHGIFVLAKRLRIERRSA